MDPINYVNVFLSLNVLLSDDTTVVNVQIRNYLQSGKGDQSTRAQQAQATLSSKVTALLRSNGENVWNLPAVFYIDDYEFWGLSVQRTFIGKASPDEIQDTLWLAHKVGLIDSSNIYSYCENNLGVDCGGFVADFWGMGYPQAGAAVFGSTGMLPRSFWNLDRNRRRAVATQIAIGDAIIFFKHMLGDDTDLANVDPTKGGEAFHIGMVGAVTPHSDTIDLTIVESSGGPSQQSGGGSGVRARDVTLPLKTAKGLVYADAGKNAAQQNERLYFVGPPANLSAYMPYDY